MKFLYIFSRADRAGNRSCILLLFLLRRFCIIHFYLDAFRFVIVLYVVSAQVFVLEVVRFDSSFPFAF